MTYTQSLFPRSFRAAAACALTLLCWTAPAEAQVSFTGTTYTQDFNTLATTGSANTWTNNSTLAGWSLFRGSVTPTPVTTYRADSGNSSTGAFYSFGSTSTSDRALGSSGSGGLGTAYMAFAATNDTGSTISSFTLGYSGEQWRDGGAATPISQTMVVQYGFGTSFSAVTGWTTAGSGFNFTSPVFANLSAGAAVDGNVAGKTTGLGGTISASWTSGATLWVRFIETNDAGNDHSLAIDDFSLSTAAIPEPGTYAAIIGGLALAGAIYRRSRRPSRG
ncbi:MAG: PEP-CTERM sorting domain-containing protein [Verrucomicrobiota bacterium]